MGLDMYLNAKKDVPLEVATMMAKDDSGKQSWDAEFRDYLNESWMGKTATAKAGDIVTATARVGYWRKANAIHNWFVENVQDGNDNCDEYEVSAEQLRQLREDCQEALKASVRIVWRSPTCCASTRTSPSTGRRSAKIGTTYRSRSTPAPVYVRPDRSAPTRRNSYAGKEILRETILRTFSDVDTFSLSDIAKKLNCTRQSAAGAVRTLEAYKLAAFVREKRVRGGRAKVYTIKHRDAPEFRMPPTEGAAAAVSAIDRFWYRKETA